MRSMHAGRRSNTTPQMRVRSYSNVGAAGGPDSHPATPDAGSPGDTSPCRDAQPPGSTGGHSSDAYVHLRRVHTGKPPKYGERGRSGAGGAPAGALGRWSRYLRASLERRIAVVIVSGMLLGAVLHLIVSFESIVTGGGGSASYLPVPSSAALHGSYPSTKRRMAVDPPAIRATPPGRAAAADPTTLGMPGDSDRLPNTPVWDAAAWRGPARTPPDDPDWPNTLALCAIMKSEHPDDVVQWVKYHRWLGVDQIFLKENGPAVSPALEARLQPFIDDGFLYLGSLPGPKHPLQNRWYNRCSKPDMAGAASWVAFIDLDEFIVVLDECVTLFFVVVTFVAPLTPFVALFVVPLTPFVVLFVAPLVPFAVPQCACRHLAQFTLRFPCRRLLCRVLYACVALCRNHALFFRSISLFRMACFRSSAVRNRLLCRPQAAVVLLGNLGCMQRRGGTRARLHMRMHLHQCCVSLPATL